MLSSNSSMYTKTNRELLFLYFYGNLFLSLKSSHRRRIYAKFVGSLRNLLDMVQRVVRTSSIWLPEFAPVSRNNSVSHRASSFASCKLLLSRSADRIRESRVCKLPFLRFSPSRFPARTLPSMYLDLYLSSVPPHSGRTPERQTMSGVVWGELGNVQMRLNV